MPFTFPRLTSRLVPDLQEPAPDFETIDGQLVCYEEGEAALRNGAAVLVGGLLVVSGIAGLLTYNARQSTRSSCSPISTAA